MNLLNLNILKIFEEVKICKNVTYFYSFCLIVQIMRISVYISTTTNYRFYS